MIYEEHYSSSVHNSNKNPGHLRMITIISAVQLFRDQEGCALMVLLIRSELISGCK